MLAEHPDLAGVSLTVPPNALFADDGTRGGQVGIAPVEPDRIPSPLPPGLALPLVITIQTDGPSNFSEPVPVRFPNLPDPFTGVKLPPGAKSALWSFNHDTGRWEVQGSMTVTADGNFVESDPGVGILQPGWHGSSPGSTGGGGGAGGPGPCEAEQQALQDALFGCAFGAVVELAELAPAIGCGISLGMAAASTISDCSDPTQNCWGSLAYNGLFGVAGCIPGVGLYAGALQCSIELGAATGDLAACQSIPQRARPGLNHPQAASPRLADDSAALQDRLFAVQSNLFVALYGTPLWMEAAAADPVNTAAFGNALVAALDPASEQAARLSAAEQAALLALPVPNGLPAATRQALLDRFDRWTQGGMTAAERAAISEAGTALQAAATAAQEAGWETMLDGLLAQLAEITQVNDQGLRGAAAGGGAAAAAARQPAAHGAGGYGPLRTHELLYHLVDLRTGFVRRGRTAPNGQLDNLITGLDTPYLLTYLDPLTLEVGITPFRSGGAGLRYTLPLGLLTRLDGPDSDRDGLNDPIEQIVGTRADQADTDGDGTTDLVEVRQGQNPLDGLALPQGVVANLPLGGSTTGLSREVVALGLHVDGTLVFVANGKRGLAVVDAADPLQPRWLGELDLPGESFDVTSSPTHRMAALVATPEQFTGGERGLLHFVDVADPAAPVLRQTFSLPVTAVDHWDGRFFVALGQFALKEVRIYDAGSALEVGRLVTRDFPTGLRVVGGRAYVATLTGLEIFEARPGALNRLGRLAGDFTPELLGRAHLVLYGTTLYVGKTRGVATIDVSDPAAPRFIGQPPATTGAARSLVLSGGPRLVAISLGTPSGNPSSSGSVSVYDAADRANTTTFLFGMTTPGNPRDLALLGGFALVADDRRGLTVVNFADADLARQGPAITFEAGALDADPATDGVQVPAGAALELAPRVRDDVHLTRVELLLDGAPVQAQTTYPVNFALDLPVATGPITVQFRATDGAGNVSTSEPVTLHRAADTAPPALVTSLPSPNAAAFLGQPFVLTFNEPVDTLPVDPARVRVVHWGADAAPGGGDDAEFAPTEATARGAVLALRFPAALQPGRCQLTVEADAVKDRAANPLAQALSLTFDLVDAHPGAAVWISDADGLWSNPNNWLHGRLPAQDDDVVLQRFGTRPLVTADVGGFVKSLRIHTPFTTSNRGNLSVLRDLTATATVTLPAGNMGVDGAALFEQALTLSGGTLSVGGRLETRAAFTWEKGGTLTLAGPQAQWVRGGSLQGANFRLIVRDGAVISLSGLATYDGPGDFTGLFPAGTTFQALGAGSRLTLPDLTSASGPMNWNVRGAPSLVFEAGSGGRVELPALTTLSNRVKLVANGPDSLLTAPALTSVTGTEAPFPAGLEARNNGRVQVPSLTTLINCPITELDGGVVERP